jgi:hypothetical protein
LDGNVVVASECFFRNKFIADNKEYGCQTGLALYVHPEYRKYAIGANILLYFRSMHPERNAIVNGFSNVAEPMYKALKFTCFETPRLVLLKKSRSVIEFIFKRICWWTKPFEIFANVLLSLCVNVVYKYNRIRTKDYTIERVNECPKDVEQIVLDDPHRFKELHDKKWFDWSLKYDFKDSSKRNKELYVVKNKEGMIVAFFLNKIKFYEQASHRGFKNVYLGSVSEWGIKPNENLTESDLQILATRYMPIYVDGCEVTTTNPKTLTSLRRNLFIHLGSIKMAIYIKSIKDKAINEITNWRIRIAGSDTLLN